MNKSLRVGLFGLVALVALLGWAAPAAAHTEFGSSDPTDGATVAPELSSITITFTNEAAESGEGFVVFDPVQGERSPSRVDTPSVGVFVLAFEPALGPGEIAVRWTVKAPDAHAIDGTFLFTIEAAAGDQTAEDPDGDQTAAAPAGARDPALEEFLSDGGTSSSGRTLANAGRFLAMGAMIVAVGFLVFALTVMRGTRRELQMLLFWIRRAGLVIVIGTMLDALGQVIFESGDGLAAAFSPSAYPEALYTSLGLALLVRLVGAIVIVTGARVSIVHAHDARDRLRRISAALPIGAGSTRVADHPIDQWDDQDVAWDLDRHGFAVVVGVALLLVSHTFDGHTVTEGNRFLTGTASGLHVFAAAVWAGGVAALALIVRRRARRGEPTHALVMVTRFSVVATLALAAVALLGIYLAVVILDSPSDLWATDWGRLLLAKSTVVAVAIGLGAHNHHVIVPALEAAEEDHAAVSRLRSALRNEVIVLSLVTGLTALLVRAASTL